MGDRKRRIGLFALGGALDSLLGVTTMVGYNRNLLIV